MLASLAPPVHLSGERLGWTLLVCVVSDFRRGHLEISWRSASEDHSYIAPHSAVVTRRHRGHNPVATITVATRNWPSYSCSVRQRKHSKVTRRHRVTSSVISDEMCLEDEDEDEDKDRKDLAVRTNMVVVLGMRLLLMKIIVFNTLMTIYAVIK